MLYWIFIQLSCLVDFELTKKNNFDILKQEISLVENKIEFLDNVY